MVRGIWLWWWFEWVSEWVSVSRGSTDVVGRNRYFKDINIAFFIFYFKACFLKLRSVKSDTEVSDSTQQHLLTSARWLWERMWMCMRSNGHPFGFGSVQWLLFSSCIWLLYLNAEQTELVPSPMVWLCTMTGFKSSTGGLLHKHWGHTKFRLCCCRSEILQLAVTRQLEHKVYILFHTRKDCF